MRSRGRVWRSIFSLGIAVAVGLAVTAVRAQEPAGGAPAGPLAGDKYKNIQVLKDVPAEQIEATMHFIEAATGMKCGDCHVQEANGQFAFDKDDKRAKQTAREMMKIVLSVNHEFFKDNVNVSCMTCHRGAQRPVGQPPFASMLTPEEVAAMNQPPRDAGTAGGRGRGGRGGGRGAPPSFPVDPVIDKYVDAIGGRAAVENLKTLILSGTLSNRAGQTLSFTIEEKLPNKYRESVQAQPPTARGFDGQAGWAQTGAMVSTYVDFRLQDVLRIADLGRAANMKEIYKNLHAARAPQIDGRAVVAIAGDVAPNVTETLMFDPDSGLLLRRAIQTKTSIGTLPEEIDYSDYRDVAGVKLPFLIKRSAWDFRDTLEVVDVKPNAQIDNARFAKPQGLRP